MRRLHATSLIVLAVSASFTPLGQAAGHGAEFLVGFEQPPGLAKGGAYAGGRVLHEEAALRFATVRADDASFRERALRDPNVRFVEPNGQMRASVLGDDPLAPEQYAIQTTGLQAAWNVTRGSPDARVCVADSGVRLTHEDVGRYVAGWDFVEADGAPQDLHGHGTHVATIAAGTAGNGVGIAGVAQSGLLVARVLDWDGYGWYDDIASGIRWCADQGAHVITLSLGGAVDSTPIREAVRYASGRGSLLVAAAGNAGPCADCVGYPARYDEVLAVGCTTSARAACGFTSSGPEVDLAAPGAGIVAGDAVADDAYARRSGTSMSAPFVAGLAALLKSHEPGLTAPQLRERLLAATRDAGAPGRDNATGAGEADASALFAAAPAPAAPDVNFTHKGGNGWWVQVAPTGADAVLVRGVDARDDDSGWTALSKQSWGGWAASFRIEPGNKVWFRATLSDGRVASSCAYTHPAGVQECGTATTPPVPAAPGFPATFSGVKGNAYWVEARVQADVPLEGVDARVDGGAWKPLALKSWGAWAASVPAPQGSVVQLQARAAGAANLSGCYAWTAATPAACPGAGTPPPTNGTNGTTPAFDATFSGVKGNAYWVEARVAATGGTLRSVDASVNGGAWKPLALKSWGAWAASVPAPEGSVVRLRAASTTGATDVSGCYRWTAAAPTAC